MMHYYLIAYLSMTLCYAALTSLRLGVGFFSVFSFKGFFHPGITVSIKQYVDIMHYVGMKHYVDILQYVINLVMRYLSSTLCYVPLSLGH